MSAQGTLGARIIEKRKRGGDSRVVTVIGVGGGVRVCAGWLCPASCLPGHWQAGRLAAGHDWHPAPECSVTG